MPTSNRCEGLATSHWLYKAFFAAALQIFCCFAVEAAEPLILALSKTPLSLPFYVAETEGYFVAEGVLIKVNDVVGGHRTMQQLLDGQADLATSSEAVVMFNSFKRNDFAVIASFVTSRDDVKVITLNGSGITKPEHLANKRIGTIVGAASHYYLDTLALLNGADPKTIKAISLQPEAMATALKQREVDAIAVWQPQAYLAEHNVEGARALDDGGFYTLSFNLVIPRKHAGTRDDDLVKLLRALDRAQRFIANEPQKAKAILRSRLQLDQPYIDWLWPRYRYQLTLDQSLLKTLESEARWARTEGHVQAKELPNYLNFIYARPLRRVLPSAVGIVQ